MHTAIIKPQWSFVTILLMVVGFIIWWPLGLAMLAYILWGERFGGSAEKAEAWFSKQKHWAKGSSFKSQRPSGNAAFDDYRAEQLKRLEEERRRLDEEVNEFHEYMRNLHMARDREEFDRYMKNRGGRSNDNGDQPQDRSDYQA